MNDIGWAIQQIKTGRLVCRTGWNGKNMWLYLWIDGSGAFEPCIVMHTAHGLEQPGWLASQPDLLATDWQFAEQV